MILNQGAMVNVRRLTMVGLAILWPSVGGTAAGAGNDDPPPPRARTVAPEPPEPAFFHRVGLDLGLASAIGTCGLTYTAAPVAWFRGEAGVGLGVTGLQLSVMPKLVFGGFVTGVGLSFSRGEDAHDDLHQVFWVNVDALGYEFRWPGGLSLLLVAGVTIPINDHHSDFAELGDDVAAGSVLGQGRVSLGWRF